MMIKPEPRVNPRLLKSSYMCFPEDPTDLDSVSPGAGDLDEKPGVVVEVLGHPVEAVAAVEQEGEPPLLGVGPGQPQRGGTNVPEEKVLGELRHGPDRQRRD